ncbi:hypothetical protein UK23_31075 [Lentzea aerocolonigenes]|uniref:Sporulation protein SsgA n=1 Tax=Lentzea aerocolonigenes TaxID=68170 RepID=A0A0F0GPW6_LENAE|nr:SsgA family sporulation/cell division regulator [Lentzea aerocolonigenes]KJK43992.1 hypothetical protein UK23_31075 [Lentzea aerocolonigenes]
MTTNTIHQSTVFDLHGADDVSRCVRVDLGYDALDPYAVSLVFHPVSGPVRWLVARDVLIGGLLEPCGEGDLTVRPSADTLLRLEIRLTTPGGSALFVASALEIAAFVDRTLALVPPGEEDMGGAVEEALAQLLPVID